MSKLLCNVLKISGVGANAPNAPPLVAPWHASTPFAQTGQGYLRRDLWAKFCSPSKTTKLVQILIGLPESAAEKMQLLKKTAFYVNVN